MLKSKQSFEKYLRFLFVYTVLVILWGAWVRISHSGDGCGDSWPLCQGQLIPDGAAKKTWVELSHRLTSGLFGIFVIYGFVSSKKIFAKTDSTRFWMNLVLFFTVSEALLGAKLVLSGLVMGNDSVNRVVVMALHQLNSFFLTGTVIAANLSVQHAPKMNISKFRKWIVPLFLIIAVTGAWAALSTTLFQSESIISGILEDLNQQSHYLIRLRILHPMFGLLVGSAMALSFWLDSATSKNDPRKRLSLQTSLVFIFAVVFGLVTLFSLSPLWMKICHLAIAHLVWLNLIRWLWLAPEKVHAD